MLSACLTSNQTHLGSCSNPTTQGRSGPRPSVVIISCIFFLNSTTICVFVFIVLKKFSHFSLHHVASKIFLYLSSTIQKKR